MEIITKNFKLIKLEGVIIRKINISRITMSFLLLGILILVFGCSSSNTSESTAKDENITTIESVLNLQFVKADQELIELMESPENVTIIDEGETSTPETPTELDIYLEETYKSYFTENMYSNYIGAYALGFQITAYYNNFQMEVDSIDIQQNETTEGAYDFTVNVLYNKKGKEQITAKVTGRANMNEEGKITSIRFLDDNGLLEALNTES